MEHLAKGAFLAVVMPFAASSAETHWPEMANAEVTFGINTAAPRIDLELPMRDTAGVIRYTLLCRGGSEKYVDSISAKKGVNYVPPLMCLLNEGRGETEGSLLTEDDSPPWHSRGQFGWEYLQGRCANYPEYGRLRHFRLRGFELILEAKEPVFENNHLAYFQFAISVRADPSATSSSAVQTGYLPPNPGCPEVRRGNVQRMCRNNAGSYEPCSK